MLSHLGMFVNVHTCFYGNVLGADDLTVSLEGLKLEELGCRQELQKRQRKDLMIRLEPHVKQKTLKLINMEACRSKSKRTTPALALKSALNLTDGEERKSPFYPLLRLLLYVRTPEINHFYDK